MERQRRWPPLAAILTLMLLVVLLAFGLRMGAQAEEGSAEQSQVETEPTPRGTAVAADDSGSVPLAIEQDQIPVLRDNKLSPAPVAQTYQGKRPHHEFDTYVVERGDTPSGIAYQYGITTESLLGGNPFLSQESSLMQPGMELTILPIDGVLHDVKPGETLESVSKQYGIAVEEIVAYEPNNLEFPFRLYPETQILVPGAVAEVFVWTPPALTSVRGGSTGIGIEPAGV